MTEATNSRLYSNIWRQRLVRILYIEMYVDERRSAQILQAATESLAPIVCSFNVVQNAFTGLELMESADYDIVFIHKDLQHLNAEQFMKVIKSLRSAAQVVLIVEATDNTINETGAIAFGFAGVLRKGYHPLELCNIINVLISNAEHCRGIMM